MAEVLVSAFYRFCPLDVEQLPEYRSYIEERAEAHGILGLFLIAAEGFNWTCAGPANSLHLFEQELAERIPGVAPIEAKYSTCDKIPFRRLAVQIRDEIVTMGWQYEGTDVDPSNYLTPCEWNEMLVHRRDVVVLDTRNRYETLIGKFKNAVDPGIDIFTELNAWLDESEIPKSTPVMMYCTGGIRCEKASVEMKRRGYEQVYQLHGGILKYLEEFPDGSFEGECFVFDHRVAVDAKLQPTTRYKLCPHCGDAGDCTVTCIHCGIETVVCVKCAQLPEKTTCSKNCAYHEERIMRRRLSLSRS